MNETVIFIKDKYGNIKEKTSEVQLYEKNNEGYKIQFRNNSRFYSYSADRVFICRMQQDISLTEKELICINKNVYIADRIRVLWDTVNLGNIIFFKENTREIFLCNKQVKILQAKQIVNDSQKFIVRRKDGFIYHNIHKIYIFEQHVKIVYKNATTKIYNISDIEISLLHDNVGPFSYFKEVSNQLIVEDNELSSFLNNQYKDMYIEEKSIWYNFLKEPLVEYRQNDIPLVFPFHFNASQIIATKRALSSNISIIEGPPGTGKTETILNILVNLILQNKTVAVVSGNNYAVENIQTKLKEYNLEFLTALLGNIENCTEFFEAIHMIPDFSFYALEKEEVVQLQNQITEEIQQIQRLLELKNQLAKIKLELGALENEYLYFEDNFRNAKVTLMNFSNLSMKQLANLVSETYIIPQNKKLSFLKKLKLLFKYHFVYFSDLEKELDKVQLNLQRWLYIQKKKTLQKEISAIEQELEKNDFDTLNENIRENSMKIFKDFLYQHYKKNGIRVFDNIYKSENNYLSHFQEFIKMYPIVLSTVHSLKKCSGKDFLYDYIIIDEASQTDLVAAGVALSCARNVIIVGDLKQLSPIVPENIKKKVAHLSKVYKIQEGYDYVENNILSSVKKLYKDITPTLLKEHYRCHPQIIAFCNQFFYEDKLIIHTTGDSREEPLILIESSKGTHSRENEEEKLLNLREIEECLRYYPSINKENFAKTDIGFISPFNAQVDLAEQQLEKDIFKSTINKFQGQECKIIIFSTVLDNSSRTNAKRLKFVNDNRLVNVAVSRAKKRFVLISNKDAFKPGSTIAELTNYMQYNSLSKSIIQSDVYSIFDLMYKEYSEKLLAICIKNIKKISDYPSENLANYVIEEVLASPKYKFLEVTFSVNLKKIIKNEELLTQEEKQFVYNTSSEVDFVIYNKNSHMPVLVIEVDGYAFHHKKVDRERDALKDKILSKYNIAFLRLPTNSSNERNKLEKALDNIIEKGDQTKDVFVMEKNI